MGCGVEHLTRRPIQSSPARCAPSVPVIVDERADAGLDARVARELCGVLHVSRRSQDEDVLGSVGPGAVPDCSPPTGDAALDHCKIRR